MVAAMMAPCSVHAIAGISRWILARSSRSQIVTLNAQLLDRFSPHGLIKSLCRNAIEPG
jgi:hypothetical protein